MMNFTKNYISIRRNDRLNRIPIKFTEPEDDYKPDELMMNVYLVLKGDTSNIQYFDSYFDLPGNRSFSKATDLSQIMTFIMKAYCQDESPLLSYKALQVINRLTNLENIDLSFLDNNDFYQRSLSLLESPNKVMAIDVLITLTNFVAIDNTYLANCIRLGYPEKIPCVADFSKQKDFSGEIYTSSIHAVIRASYPLCKLNLSTEFNNHLWNIALSLLMIMDFDTANAGGLLMMLNLIEVGYVPVIDDIFLNRIASLVNSPKNVLDYVFALISNNHFPNYQEFAYRLSELNFYNLLFKRMNHDPSIIPKVYNFIEAMIYVPQLDDPIISKSIEILKHGDLKHRICALKYLYSLTFELPHEYLILLSQQDLLYTLSEIIDSRCEVFPKAIELTEKIFNAMNASGFNVHECPGFSEVLESMQKVIGEENSFYDSLIYRILDNVNTL